jgi:outer membrane protein assembly factor BamB
MNANRTAGALVAGVMLLGAGGVCAQDWPQWRGPNRDAKATGFTAPKTWPKELTKKWQVKVGDGVATPALVGDRLFVFTREGGDEVLRCLQAADGKEVWKEKYASAGFGGPDSGFQGPRSSPAVADGKVVTLGAQGILTCFDTAGKKLWQKDEFKGFRPTFHASSSPIIVDGLCITQVGGRENGQRDGKENGGIVAYDLTSGDEKWKWTGDGPGYASPVLLTLGGTKAIVAETDGNVVALNAADGKQLWKTAFKVRYNACTPMVDGQTVIYSGSGGGGMRRGGGGGGGGAASGGTKAVKLEKSGDAITAKDLWSNPDTAVMFDTPVIKNGLIFGITADNKLFCVNEQTGKTAWSTAIGGGGGGGGGGGRGMMGGGGYGSVVDAGPVLLALTPAGQLIVFEPNEKEFKEVAKYKVADGSAYAYPVVSGNRVFVKDKDSVTLWTID